MSGDSDTTQDDVSTTVEITGEYETVMEKLGSPRTVRDDLDTVLTDLEMILETIDDIDGGTRSAIASALPAATTIEYDTKQIVAVMRVLEQYDLVELDENTWRPGSALESP